MMEWDLGQIVKARFRFTADYDLHLAREVVGQNPYEDPQRWYLIQVNMLQITGKQVSVRTLKERILNLVKKHLAKIKEMEAKSGVEEITTVFDDLIQQIIELMKAFQVKKNKVVTSTTKLLSSADSKSSYQKGYECREKSIVEFNDVFESVEVPYNNSEIEVELELTEEQTEYPHSKENTDVKKQTPRRRPLAQKNILTPSKRKNTYTNTKQFTIQYLSKKSERQHEIRSRELDIRERGLILEEKRFQLECEERKNRIEIESKRVVFEEKRLKVLLDLFESQKNKNN